MREWLIKTILVLPKNKLKEEQVYEMLLLLDNTQLKRLKAVCMGFYEAGYKAAEEDL